MHENKNLELLSARRQPKNLHMYVHARSYVCVIFFTFGIHKCLCNYLRFEFMARNGAKSPRFMFE